MLSVLCTCFLPPATLTAAYLYPTESFSWNISRQALACSRSESGARKRDRGSAFLLGKSDDLISHDVLPCTTARSGLAPRLASLIQLNRLKLPRKWPRKHGSVGHS